MCLRRRKESRIKMKYFGIHLDKVTHQLDRSVFSKFKLEVDIYVHCCDLLKIVVEYFPQSYLLHWRSAPRSWPIPWCSGPRSWPMTSLFVAKYPGAPRQVHDLWPVGFGRFAPRSWPMTYGFDPHLGGGGKWNPVIKSWNLSRGLPIPRIQILSHDKIFNPLVPQLNVP